MSKNVFYIGIIILVIGIITFIFGDKKRNPETGEWSSALQWGYLLIMAGVAGILTNFISLTAILLIFTLITFIAWVVDHRNRYHMRKIGKDGSASGHFIDYMSGFFTTMLIIFVVRTFIVEPFVIPSSSMRPGLVVGDFVLVNKFSYGIRMPILNNVIIPTGKVQRGDVVVFHYPKNPTEDYIKRIVAIPGDTISYKNKVLSINGKVIKNIPQGDTTFPIDNPNTLISSEIPVNIFSEQIDNHHFNIFQIPGTPTLILKDVDNPYKKDCQYNSNGFTCTLPAGKYFAMGDNRDDSSDSRYWGFVDDNQIIGKAFLIWLNFKKLNRIGTSIQ